MALAVAALGAFVPLGFGDGESASVAGDGAAWVYVLVVAGLVFAALVFHATEPERPEWPITFVMVVSFALGVFAVILALGMILATLGLNTLGQSVSIGPGAIMLPLGIITLLFSSMRVARDVAIGKAIARAEEVRGRRP
jgi:hypothetical protein